MSDELWKVVVAVDRRPIYPAWCRLFAHQWVRYGYELTASRPRSCRRCEHIPPPRRFR